MDWSKNKAALAAHFHIQHPFRLDHQHHQLFNVPTAEAQVFLMDYT
jgi:hypothetical protein